MKIKVEQNGSDTVRTHVLVARRCNACNRLFMKYSKAKKCCSKACENKILSEKRRAWLNEIKKDPYRIYKHRRATIDQREKERKAKIMSDLPNIKKAMAASDESLVEYIFNHYGFISTKARTYKKPKEDHE